MNKPVASELRYDGSFWEASLPETWIYRCEKSIKYSPYYFESNAGARLVVTPFGGQIQLIGTYDIEEIPEGYEQYRNIYLRTLFTACDCRKQWFDKLSIAERRQVIARDFELSKCKYGELIGFTFEPNNQRGRYWAGIFQGTAFYFEVQFDAPSATFDLDLNVAISILSSIKSHMPGPDSKRAKLKSPT